MPHYAVYGFIAAVIYEAYKPIGAWAILVFALPLFLMRKTQEAYLKHTQRSAHKLRAAAETIQSQNVSLEQANKLLKERSTAAMESLSATVDARDAYTAGHSRRVQQLALAVGRELGLSQAELELLGHAALFHDIGKLGIPDAILLKPGALTDEEWVVMASHAEEGASIINRLGFLSDAVPAIRHHHERFDGGGYPDGLAGEDIPLGARIIHVADAFDSMLTTRVYRPATARAGRAGRAAPERGHPVLPALRRRPRGDRRDGDRARRRTVPGRLASRTCAFSVRSTILGGGAEAVSRGGRDRPAGARGVPGGDPAPLHGRSDPRGAARVGRAARALADDEGVRGRPGGRDAPADGDRALRDVERGEAGRRPDAAPVRDTD